MIAKIKKIPEMIRHSAKSLINPVLIHRMTCLNGERVATIILKRPWGAKAVAKFEVLRELDPNSTYPEYKEIGLSSFHVKEREIIED